MIIKIGIDVLNKKRFEKSLARGGESFLKRVFTVEEIKHNTSDELASVFSVKEAVMKALEIVGIWKNISTSRKVNGKLACSLIGQSAAKRIVSLDTSVTHDGQLIITVAVVVLRK